MAQHHRDPGALCASSPHRAAFRRRDSPSHPTVSTPDSNGVGYNFHASHGAGSGALMIVLLIHAATSSKIACPASKDSSTWPTSKDSSRGHTVIATT